MKKVFNSLILILLISSNLYSQGIPYNQEFRVNTYIDSNVRYPSIAALVDGGFVVCWSSFWQSHVPDSSGSGIFGQIFEPTGIKRENEFQVNTFNTYHYYYSHDLPAVAGLKDGGFVVCWESWHQDGSGYGIFGQLFDGSGAKRGNEFQVNTYTKDWQSDPAVTELSDGGFVVCWESREPDSSGYISISNIFAQMFDTSGAKRGFEFQINTYKNNWQSNASIAGLPDGGFVVCWQSSVPDRVGYDIFGQLFDVCGAKRGNEFQVSTYTKRWQGNPSVAALQDGGFVVCWESHEQVGYDTDIFAQMFDASGAKRGNEFRLNTYTKDGQWQSLTSVAGLPDGGFFVCWYSGSEYGGTIHTGIFGQMFDASGGKRGNEFLVNNYRYDRNYWYCYPSVAKLQHGGLVVCWVSAIYLDPMSYILGKYFLSEPIIHQLQEYSLIIPFNNATLNTTRPTFHWHQPSTIRECYPWELTFDLYIDTDSNFPNPEIIKNIQDTAYTIDSLAAGKTYFWKVLAKNLAGDSLWSKQQDWGFFIKPGATLVENADNEKPQQFELFQNYPNPFNSSTEIRYTLPSGKASYQVQLKVYDTLGRLVKVLVDEEQAAGTYAISWDGTDWGGNRVASGVYFYRLEAGNLKSMQKMLLMQ